MEFDFERTKENFLNWAYQQMAQGVPRQVVCTQLLGAGVKGRTESEWRAHLDAEHELSVVMLQRNLDGKEFEKEGSINKAIEVYEQNLEDSFYGSFPYERLRIIYTKQKRYSDAIRVCKAFLILYTYNDNKRNRFINYLEKLEKKLRT